VGLTAEADMLIKYANRSDMRHASPVDIVTFKGAAKSLSLGVSNPNLQVCFCLIQYDRTIEKVISYDRRVFSAHKNDKTRNEFLWTWFRKGRVTFWDPAPKILSLYVENALGEVVGYGSISPTIVAAKIAPLYADSPEIAKLLIAELVKVYSRMVSPIDQLVIRVPSVKSEFIDFLSERGFAAMLTLKVGFTKAVPHVGYDRIFGVACQVCQLY